MIWVDFVLRPLGIWQEVADRNRRMSATFHFEIDRSRSLVRITMAGLFKPADIRAFDDARREAHAGWTARPTCT